MVRWPVRESERQATPAFRGGGVISIIQLHHKDNVAVARTTLGPGQSIELDGQVVTVRQEIAFGHKLATRQIDVGQPVRKYGEVIGSATERIEPGSWVHEHNLELGEFDRDPDCAGIQPVPLHPLEGRTFQGYHRANGSVGTRNYIGVISTVNCSASVSKFIARHFDSDRLSEFPNVDGVVAFTHEGGCGMPPEGLKHQMLNRVLGGIARHPNIGAYLLIGLGCEQASMDYLLEDQHLVNIEGQSALAGSPHIFSLQQQGGTMRTVDAGVRRVAELLPLANEARRESAPASKLILGTECGGSDGNSGITANPAVGVAADLLVRCGGTVILSETPEIFGAEHLLTRRAVSVEVAQKLLDRIAWWQEYVGKFDARLDNNPSPGNKKGGLTTIAEKSLGAVAKAGSTALVDVYEYAQPVTARGMVVMDTPGYDPPSVTGMVAGGANLIVFTTGRGSCFGCKPTPSLKVATNSPMYERMIDDMDINAGPILDGVPVSKIGHEIFDTLLEVAGGSKTKSELHGIGDEEFLPWTVGPTL